MTTLLAINPPNELTFQGPFVEVVTSILSLTNTTDSKVCFKVKTTAPRRYCVRPNSGVIEPKETMEVQIMLQPFSYDPNEKNNHKFMVQSTVLEEEMAGLAAEEIWKKVSSGNIVDKKLRCVFSLPEAGAAAPTPAATADPVNPVNSTFVTKPDTGLAKPVAGSSDVQKLKERVEDLTRENTSLKNRVGAAASRQAPAVEPAFHNAAYYIIFVIIGWLIAKFVI